jgi:hypothetical protein
MLRITEYTLIQRSTSFVRTEFWHGVDGHLIEWTEEFLTNRTVQITVEACDGDVSQINTGMQQGSPVCPILFVTSLSCLFPLVDDKVDRVEGISFADDVGW